MYQAGDLLKPVHLTPEFKTVKETQLQKIQLIYLSPLHAIFSK